MRCSLNFGKVITILYITKMAGRKLRRRKREREMGWGRGRKNVIDRWKGKKK
jgi:hypothetical protein